MTPQSTQPAATRERGEGVDAAVDRERPRILAALAALEREYNFRVVYACESGSRAWGFASVDSDFDVRFIYVRPVADYLRLRPPVDAFDVQAERELDLGGWDIRKAAELMRKSNPPLLEWLDSPIVYRADDVVTPELIRLRSVYFDAKKAVYHYLSMAKRVYDTYLDETQPKRKKYLYVLRPLACMRYIAMHRTQPPTRFVLVLERIDWSSDAMQAVDELVRAKCAGDELGRAPRNQVLDELIRAELAEAEESATALPPNNVGNQALDHLIQLGVLGEVKAANA